MNKLILIASLALLTSCGWMIPPPFDTNEYGLYAELETHSRFLRTECVDPDKASKRVYEMLFVVEQLSTYTYYLPDNVEMYEATSIIAENIIQLAQKYSGDETPSVSYCELKSKIITSDTRDVLESLGDLK